MLGKFKLGWYVAVALANITVVHASEVPDVSAHLNDSECLQRNSDDYCATQTSRFVDAWQKAFEETDLDAMRSVAYELSADTFKVLDDNPVLSCAFRLAITQTGDLSLRQEDFAFVSKDGYCSLQYLDFQQMVAFPDLASSIRRIQRELSRH